MAGAERGGVCGAEQAQREAEGRYPVEQGSGVNAHVYFVCNALGDPRLTRLPDARPEHIMAARALKRLLTGRLSSAVSMYPPFPWDEAVFLRAQIARIAAATVLAPAGWYSLEEDDGGASVVTRAEEIEPVAAPEGEAEEWLASWVHRCARRSRWCRLCVLLRAAADDKALRVQGAAPETAGPL